MRQGLGEPMAAGHRILVINPNTNPLVTRRVSEVALRCSGSQLEFEVINPAAGPFSIETDEDKEQAEKQVLRLIAERETGKYDAYVLACFDDLALNAARRRVNAPVIGCCEAGIGAALAVSPALAIITTFPSALPGVRLLIHRYNAGQGASVRAAGVGVEDAARAGPETRRRLLHAIKNSVDEDGAQVELLASGGLAGQAPSLSAEAGVPVVDAVEAALVMAASSCQPHAIKLT